MAECFEETTLLDDCFIVPKIHFLHHAEVSIKHEPKGRTETSAKTPDHV